ncbi:peptide ABC transporter substrate-binding protein [Candidatus Parcubacteria bacterium]|nr:peptide ABC transporter substrate-binding protein [Candidatus Parcubacteria bacterium]
MFIKKNKKQDGGNIYNDDLDKKLVLSLSKSRIPKLKQLKYIGNYLSKLELWFLYGSIAIALFSAIFFGIYFYYTHLEIVPKKGGEYAEGLVGTLKYINPLYEKVSDVDNDISKLIFSSLFKRDKNGELARDLVKNYQISDDKKVYSFKIREDAKWHDGAKLTANDVYFTFNAIKEPGYKSPLRTSFTGVTIEMIDDYNFKFVLSNPYAAFFELLTFGIMPSEPWSLIRPEAASLAGLNLEPIGSGPYEYSGLAKEKKLGTIKEYKLTVNENYYDKKPYTNINFKFYATFADAVNALNNNETDGLSYLPPELKADIITPKTFNFYNLYLPQTTVIFFNQEKNPALADKALRQAMAYAIDKNFLINDLLNGGAYGVNGPILPNSFAYYNEQKKYDYNVSEAEKLLDSIDWKIVEINTEMIEEAEIEIESEDEDVRAKAEKIIQTGEGAWRKKDGNFLTVNLRTIDKEEYQKIVEEIKKYWEVIGIKVVVEIIPASQAQARVIKPRDYEALFYGQVLGADPDPYSFWHSSQANEHGFNIANFVNKEVDKLLEDARLTSEISIRQENYKKFQEIIAEEVPAIFMYSPLYTYVQGNSVKGFDIKNIFVPSDRFNNISDWYLETEKKLVF